jgi:hypothetical protein
MYRIFISYRRSDSESFSGRVRDRLRAEFGKRSIFMDTSTISGGARFDQAIAQNLISCKVFIAVIGKTWLDCRNDAGTRRLDDPADWVRKEVAEALVRDDVLVIPVLCGGATMPPVAALPSDLKPLVTRNAVPIDDADFDSDVARLIEACEPHVSRPRRWPWVAGAAALLAVAGAAAYVGTRPDFRGVYLVPGVDFAGKLPEEKNAARKKHYNVVLSANGKRVNIQDLTRKSLFVAEADLDASPSSQDIGSLRSGIAQHFKLHQRDDADAIAANLSSNPNRVSLKVRAGDRISAEITSSQRDASGGFIRAQELRCEFAVPANAGASAPIFYLSPKSDECKSAG